MIEIGAVEIRKSDEPFKVQELDLAFLERQQTVFTQLPQDAIDVYRAEAKGVSKKILGQRAGIA